MVTMGLSLTEIGLTLVIRVANIAGYAFLVAFVDRIFITHLMAMYRIRVGERLWHGG